MNQKKAKQLRKAIGFVPSAERLYTSVKCGPYKSSVKLVATGDRKLYQEAKKQSK